MVAPSTATRVIHDPDDAHPGGELPSIPAHLHSRILSELCDPASSLLSVARNFRIAVDVLALWLGEPEVREKMLRIEKGGYAHTRMAASVTLASTVNVLHTIIEDFTQVRAHARSLREHERLPAAASRHDPLPSSHYHQHSKRAFLPGEALLAQDSFTAQRLELRRADCVRRAAHHLYRLSRIVPVDDSKLALAASHRTASVSESPTISEPRASARAVEDRTSRVSERVSSTSTSSSAASDSSLSNQPAQWGAAGALQDLPLAAGLTPDANSSRVPLVPVEHAPACETEPVLQDAQSPDPTPLRVESTSPSPVSPCRSVALRGESSSSQSCSSRSSPCLGASVVNPSSPPLRGPPRSPR